MSYSVIVKALSDTLGLVEFRALPVVGAYLTDSGRPLPRKALIGFFYLGVAWLEAAGAMHWVCLCGAYLYFAGVSCAAPVLARAVGRGRVTRGACFALLASAFFVVPAVALPLDGLKGAVLLIAWDCVLSSYSYCVEVRDGNAGKALSACLFFILVNPSLIYTRRGIQLGPPSFDPRGLARVARGVGTIFFANAVLGPGSVYLHDLQGGDVGSRVGVVAATTIVAFLYVYGAASGLASLQIGMMRLLGFEIPERFNWPFAARDPGDFWRRWNTYVTGWLERYVFLPVAGAYRKESRLRRSRVPHATATLATFAAAGLLHDVFFVGADLSVRLRSTVAFVLAGALLLMWQPLLQVSGRLAESRSLGLLTRSVMWTATLSVFSWWRA